VPAHQNHPCGRARPTAENGGSQPRRQPGPQTSARRSWQQEPLRTNFLDQRIGAPGLRLHISFQAEAGTGVLDKIERLVDLRTVKVDNEVVIAARMKFACRCGAVNPELPLVGKSKVCEFLPQLSKAGADLLHAGLLAIRKRLDFHHAGLLTLASL